MAQSVRSRRRAGEGGGGAGTHLLVHLALSGRAEGDVDEAADRRGSAGMNREDTGARPAR